jgi:hypothetical protein
VDDAASTDDSVDDAIGGTIFPTPAPFVITVTSRPTATTIDTPYPTAGSGNDDSIDKGDDATKLNDDAAGTDDGVKLGDDAQGSDDDVDEDDNEDDDALTTDNDVNVQQQQQQQPRTITISVAEATFRDGGGDGDDVRDTTEGEVRLSID